MCQEPHTLVPEEHPACYSRSSAFGVAVLMSRCDRCHGTRQITDKIAAQADAFPRDGMSKQLAPSRAWQARPAVALLKNPQITSSTQNSAVCSRSQTITVQSCSWSRCNAQTWNDKRETLQQPYRHEGGWGRRAALLLPFLYVHT